MCWRPKRNQQLAPIAVSYARGSNTGLVVEKHGYRTKLETTTVYSKGHSAGGTQYISQDGKSVITGFGLSGEYYAIVKYIRMQRSDGGPLNGYRHDSYLNVFMDGVAVE